MKHSKYLLVLTYLLGGVLSDPDSVSVPFPDGKAPDGTRYKKDYRCESEQLTLSCKVHERIRVIRANYGRFSLAICNKHGSTELSVKCMSPQTTGILKAKCDNLSNCTMQVNSHVFGEPCPGVQKYLELHYACVTQSGLHSGTTPRLPSWLREGAAGNLWTDTKDSYSEDINESTDELEYEDDFEDPDREDEEDELRRKPILVQATTPLRIPITTPKPTTTSTTTSSQSSSESISQDDPGVRVNELAHVNQLEIVSSHNEGVNGDPDPHASGCPPATARFLLWNRTSPGEISIQPCPEGTTGLARWICGHDERRETYQPDMSDCKSHSMSELEASVRNEEPESVIASRLSILTGKRFFGGDLETSVSVIKSISNRLQYLIRHKENFYNKASFVSDVFQNIFRSASNLLNNHAVWKDVSETSRRSKIASDMVSVLEDCAFLWADALEEPEIVYESTNNAVMAISSTLESHQTFPSTPNTPEWFGNQDSISLALPEASEKDLSKMVFFSYKDLHTLLPPKKLEADLASRVISADVRRSSSREKTQKPGITILFHHNHSEGGGPPLSCGRWDEELGDWSLEGCYVLKKEATTLTCSCSSPGMFALISPKKSLGGFPHEQSINAASGGGLGDLFSLEIATYIVSIICFLIILLIIVQFRKQIGKLLKKSSCCCCICLERDNGDKSRDLYTGATLMEAASSGANASTTTASSSSGSSSSTTLPSRMVALSAEGNRMSGNTLTIRSRLARESAGVPRVPGYSAGPRGTASTLSHQGLAKWDEGGSSPLTGKRRPSITVNPAIFRRRPEASELSSALRSNTPRHHQYYSSETGSFSSSYNASPSHALHTDSTGLEECHVYAEIEPPSSLAQQQASSTTHLRHHQRAIPGGQKVASRGRRVCSGSSSSEDTVSDLQRISDFSDDEGYDLTPRNLIMNDKNLSVVV